MPVRRARVVRRALPVNFAEQIRWENYVECARANRQALRVISEGDSWFAFSLSGPALDGCVVDLCKSSAVFLDLAENGDTASTMFGTTRGSKLLRTVLRRAKRAQVAPHLMLISGGGNDVLANQLEAILRSNAGPDEPAEAWIDRPALASALLGIEKCFQELISLCETEAPNCRIVFHSYSYLERLGKSGLFGSGPWVANKMSARGLEKVAVQREVVRLLLDSFHEEVLRPLVSSSTAVVDLRDKLKKFQPKDAWFDEIHPSPAGYRKLAVHYLPVLRPWFPDKF